jgi:hypothetical protein
MSRLLRSPLTPLAGLSLMTTALLCAYVIAGVAPSLLAQALLSFAWALFLILWADADARRRRKVPCYDFGFIAGLTYPVSLGWYCLWSRGWRGLLLLLALIALACVPWLIAAAF